MAIKRYSTFPRSPELKPYNQMQLSAIFRTPLFWGKALFPCKGCSQRILSITDREKTFVNIYIFSIVYKILRFIFPEVFAEVNATVSAWKNSVNAAVGGVGLLIGPRALKTLNSVEKIQPRMMAATFNGNPRATIISCYSPTNVSEENELVTFYDELSSLVRSIPKHNMLVIGGDMNAQIGKNGNNKYSLHNTSNRNGQHLTDFMIENRLACLNTNYQKREGKLWTYTHANNTKAQIDYVLINKKWKNSALNCEAYSSFEGVSTDHRIVTAKIRLSLRKNAKRTATTKHYDWALLNNKEINTY